MYIKITHLFIPGVLFILLLAGCKPVTISETQNLPTAQQTFQVPGYPTPELSALQAPAYPGPTQINVNLPPDPPLSAPEPETGKASVSGAIYSYTTKIRIAGTYAYLTPGRGDQKDQMPNVIIGPQKEIGDIPFTTDEKGNFELNNVPPGKYFIIVWAPLTWTEVQVSETNPKALLVDLKADQKTALGALVVSWP